MSVELQQLKTELKQHRQDQDERWEKMLAAQEENAAAISSLLESTQGVVQLYNDLSSAVRLGTALQKFTIWLAKFGIVGAAIGGAITWTLEHFGG